MNSGHGASEGGVGRRRRRTGRRVGVLLAGVLALAAFGALLIGTSSGDEGGEPVGREGPRVVATTNFVADTVREIGGDRARVEALMGPGVDPHLYRARASDLPRLREADLVVSNGLDLEAKLDDVLDGLGERTTVVRAAEGLPRDRLLGPPAGAPATEASDPHVWFDVALWRQVARRAADALVSVDPAGADGYRSRAAAYDRRLTALDAEVRRTLARVPRERRVLVTSHDAFRYLGRAYDVDVEGIQGISTAAEATSADVDRIARILAERDVPAIFVESSVPRQTVEAVRQAARSRGADVVVGGELFADAAGDAGTPEGTYVGMVRANARAIARGLSG